MDLKNCGELANKLISEHLQVSPEYVKVDVIKQEVFLFLHNIESGLSVIKDKPHKEIITIIETVMLKDPIEEIGFDESLYDLYERDHLVKLLTAGYKAWDGEPTFMEDVENLMSAYFKHKFTNNTNNI